MDTVELPFVSASESLRKAFQRMKAGKRSGVIFIADGQAWLQKAGEIVIGISDGKHRIEDLERKYPVGLASEAQLRQPKLDWLNPPQTRSAFESLLDKIDRK